MFNPSSHDFYRADPSFDLKGTIVDGCRLTVLYSESLVISSLTFCRDLRLTLVFHLSNFTLQSLF